MIGAGVAFAQVNALLPKYGDQPKSESQKSADASFLSTMDAFYKGDRVKAAEEVASRGWAILRGQSQGTPMDAMRRFNQAWLLNSKNGSAIWGMAAISANSNQMQQASNLFKEAEALLPDDIDLAVDSARFQGMLGLETQNKSMLNTALNQYQVLSIKYPNHTMNWQNWALILFNMGDYPQAWDRLQSALKTPRGKEVDPEFVKALSSKIAK